MSDDNDAQLPDEGGRGGEGSLVDPPPDKTSLEVMSRGRGNHATTIISLPVLSPSQHLEAIRDSLDG